MPFEEYAPPRPPSANAVGRDEVVVTVQPIPARSRHKGAAAVLHKMLVVTIGAGIVQQLGWPAASDGKKPTARVLFGSGPDLGKMQIARGSSVSYKLTGMKGGAVKLRITSLPPGAPAFDVQRKAVAREVIRAAAGSEAYLAVTLPEGLVPKPDAVLANGPKRVRA